MKDERNKENEMNECQIKKPFVTYEIYAAMPDDGQRYEIVEGTLEMMTPSPSSMHQTVSGELGFILRQGCKSDYIIFDAPLDVIFSESTVLQPDLLMIHRSRMHIVTTRGIEGAPDLVVEIVSPSSRRRDKIVKMKAYAKFKVPEYWIVDADSRTLDQYILQDDKYELHNIFAGNEAVVSDKLPCVSFRISEIFIELLNQEVYEFTKKGINIGDQIKEQIVTYEIYAAMPEGGQRYEIVDGLLEMMAPGASNVHQTVSRDLTFELVQSCKTDYLIYYAPFDVILSNINVLQPDIMMIHRSRKHIVTSRGIEGPPDLVVEIISPSSRRMDKIVKMEVYAKFNVQEYWIVDTDSQTLEQYQLMDGKYELHHYFEGNDIITSDKLPCVSFVISDIFRELFSN